MLNREKQAAYRDRMREKGMAQMIEWIPSDKRALFKAIAQALREGVEVQVGNAPSVETPAPPTPPPPAPPKADSAKAEQYARRQATFKAQWEASSETFTIVNPAGKGFEARVTQRKARTAQGVIGMPATGTVVSGVIKAGARFQAFEYSIWPSVGIRPNKPSGWRVVPDREITLARKRVRDLHPDKGGEGGEAFMDAKAALDALTGKKRA
jgi:hypothetical protein